MELIRQPLRPDPDLTLQDTLQSIDTDSCKNVHSGNLPMCPDSPVFRPFPAISSARLVRPGSPTASSDKCATRSSNDGHHLGITVPCRPRRTDKASTFLSHWLMVLLKPMR